MKHFFGRVLNFLVSAPLLLLLSPLLLHYYLFPDLCQRAWRALRRGDVEKAEALAKQALHQAQHKARDWNYGNDVHDANQILGLVALRSGGVKKAKRFLVLAGKTPGSPQLYSGGARLVLARELAERGESEAVLQYLDAMSRFYLDRHLTTSSPKASQQFYVACANKCADLADKESRQRYESWRQEIESGGVPQHYRWR